MFDSSESFLKMCSELTGNKFLENKINKESVSYYTEKCCHRVRALMKKIVQRGSEIFDVSKYFMVNYISDIKDPSKKHMKWTKLQT